MTKLTDNQEKWLQALESGDYGQTERTLWRKNLNGKKEYCCLGVAGELFSPNSRYMKAHEEDKSVSSKGVAPQKVISSLKLRDNIGGMVGEFVTDSGINTTTLTEMNDSGCSFKEIANFIRANPEKVFVQPEES